MALSHMLRPEAGLARTLGPNTRPGNSLPHHPTPGLSLLSRSALSPVTARGRRSLVQCWAEAEQPSPSKSAAPGDEKVPAWAEPGSSVPPPWARGGDKAQTQTDENRPFELPFGLYLLFSVFTGIAAVGSIFEYTAKNPLFGVVPPENPIWAPVLLFFAITGFPTSALLLQKAIQGFNAFADEEDKQAGL